MIYVTDTHPLIFVGTQKYSRLGRKARRIFREVDEGRSVMVIPVTVFEEIMRHTEKGLRMLKIPFHIKSAANSPPLNTAYAFVCLERRLRVL